MVIKNNREVSPPLNSFSQHLCHGTTGPFPLILDVSVRGILQIWVFLVVYRRDALSAAKFYPIIPIILIYLRCSKTTIVLLLSTGVPLMNVRGVD